MLVADGCSGTSVIYIRNGPVEVSNTERKVTLDRFDHDLSNKCIPNGASVVSIDLPNGAVSYQFNEYPIIH